MLTIWMGIYLMHCLTSELSELVRFVVEMIRVCVLRILEKSPNTYGFTKRLAEDLVHKYKSKFPIAIGRPSLGTTRDLMI